VLIRETEATDVHAERCDTPPPRYQSNVVPSEPQ
jgi:hypothetical protein